MSRPRSSSLVERLEQADRQNRRLIEEKQTLVRTVAELKMELGIFDSLSPEDVRAIREYLRLLDTLAVEADANRGINYDSNRSRSAVPPSPTLTPVYAFNLLDAHLDVLVALKEELRIAGVVTAVIRKY